MKNKKITTSTRQDLENSLGEFQKSGYEKHIKNAVLMHISEKLEEPISAENINWLNAVLNLLIRREDVFNDMLFSSETGEKYTRENVRLIHEMLDYYHLELVKTQKDLEEYRARKEHIPKLRRVYLKFKKDLSTQIKLIFPNEQEHLRYLLGAEPMFKNNPILRLLNDIEKDFSDAKPSKAKNYSQKQHNLTETYTVAVIKMINAYLEACFRIESKMTIRNHYKILETVANTFYNYFQPTSFPRIDRNTIKGFLNKSNP